MTLRLVSVDFDARDPSLPAAFWAEMLDREMVRHSSGILLPGDDTQVGLGFVEADTGEWSGPNPVHLHLTSSDLADQQRTVDRGLELDGRIIRQVPDEGHVVMADPDRNEFCVIEPTSDFLEGCGFFGEVTCEGSRDVGFFWSDALGWPLVWDRGDQTAIQSPNGGTKVSWDVRPGPPRYGTRRQRFQVEATDPEAEAARLVTLGASEAGTRDGDIVLTDPDGGEFLVTRA